MRANKGLIEWLTFNGAFNTNNEQRIRSDCTHVEPEAGAEKCTRE